MPQVSQFVYDQIVTQRDAEQAAANAYKAQSAEYAAMAVPRQAMADGLAAVIESLTVAP